MRQDTNYAIIPEEKGKLTILKKFVIIYIEGWENVNFDNEIVELRETITVNQNAISLGAGSADSFNPIQQFYYFLLNFFYPLLFLQSLSINRRH